jgi:uncharacterized protein
MSKYVSLLVALMATFITATALAFTPPPAPANGWYVVDQTGRMSAPEISALNQKILRVSQATHNEFGVAFIQSLEGDNIEDAAYDTFKSWGIGKHGLDNGVLIIVSLKDHKSRIETGKGVGGEITDLQSKQILDNTMRPRLKAGHFADAFSAAIDDLSGLMDSRANQKATPLPPAADQQSVPTSVATNQPEQSSSGHSVLVFLFIFGILGIAGIVIWLIFISKRDQEEDRLERLEQHRLYRERQAEAVQQVRSVPTIHTSAPAPVDNSSSDGAIAFAATAALLESERREEERRERRRRERQEEERQATRQAEYSAPSPSYSSSPDPTPTIDVTPTPDIGGGFGGGGSGGGGASGDW